MHMVGVVLRAIFLVLVELMLPAAFTAFVVLMGSVNVIEDGQG